MNKVGFAAPSGNVLSLASVFRAREMFIQQGWEVTMGDSVFESNKRFGGRSDEARLLDFNTLCKTQDLVLCARGGYGLNRILPEINFHLIEKKAVWVAGFSDITLFSLAYLALCGGKSLQSPTASVLGSKDCPSYTKDVFFSALNSDSYTIFFNTSYPNTNLTGLLWGGNLTVLCSLLGTKYFPKVEGGILFVEDINEAAYQTERNLLQLHQAGVLDAQSAVLVGRFSNVKVSDHDYGYGIDDAIEHVAQKTKTPLIDGLPFGHTLSTCSLVVGSQCQLIIEGGQAQLVILEAPGFHGRDRQ